MGADMKKLRGRIRHVNATLHLTRAMALVASSKMRRAMERMMHTREYEAAMRGAIEPLLNSPDCQRSPYWRQMGVRGKTCLVLIAGDRGLAGGYNANLFRAVSEYPDASVIPIGRRACDRFGETPCPAERFDYDDALGLAMELCRDFVEEKYDRVDILGTQYVSMLSQRPRGVEVLPLRAIAPRGGESAVTELEPDARAVADAAVPEYVAALLLRAVREGVACELIARRTAMDSAGKNAQEMIDALRLQYNRARQGAITQEITEIVAGDGD